MSYSKCRTVSPHALTLAAICGCGHAVGGPLPGAVLQSHGEYKSHDVWITSRYSHMIPPTHTE